MTGLRLILGNIAKPWEDSSPTGHFANLRAPQVPNFENQLTLPIVWGRPGSWGASKGSSLLEGLFSTDYARAIADVQNRGAQLYSQVEEAHNNLSEHESNIALTDGLLAGREQQLETSKAQLQERETRVSASEVQQAAWEAETAGYSPDVSGQFWVTVFQYLHAFAFPHFSLDDHSATKEEERSFCAFGVTTWAPRIWDEGVSGVFLELWGAYKNWKRADDQAQLVFDSLVAWIDALESERATTDCFMNFGRILLQEFRMQPMMAPDPGIPVFNILARLCTAVHESDAFARAIQILLEGRGTKRPVRCQLCHIYGRDASTCNVQDETGGS
ncbi:hypothetical protein TcYC6_0062760 [Trypanosoma cruzi]|nr:hypothetical protein TcYC6_0062760 [Trypanosoma cruzi]